MRLCSRLLAHLVLIVFLIFLFIPLYLALVAASHDANSMMHSPLPRGIGQDLWANLQTVLWVGVSGASASPIWGLLWNSFLMASFIALGKITLALLSAFAMIYFSFPFKKTCFALIFSTMLLPVEVRIVPTFQIVASFGGLNTYAGLTLPLMASATATFLFRQFFKTVPQELVDAARLDGASPMRFFWDILLPLSLSQLLSLFVIMFVYGWNQYLWPLVITSETNMATIVMGIRDLASVTDQIPPWHLIMTVALIALLLPCLLVVSLQHWFEKGLKR